ncbi:MAG: 4-(cytidine 5'-diphospho)-2-C-methyl-D-erythritol kinase [bacterium]
MTVEPVQAHAKINLFLAVRGRRADGYHDLDMVNVEATLTDTLRFRVRAVPGIEIECSAPDIPKGPENLIWKAAVLLLGHSPEPGISIELEKKIPPGAGLGGGSSDAAVTLRTLNRLRNLGRDDDLHELAARIGSDVPYSLVGGLCRCKGRGEQVERLMPTDSSRPWLYALLILPETKVGTAEAYRWLDKEKIEDHSAPGDLIDAIRSRDVDRISLALHNSFDTVVSRCVPAIAKIKAAVQAEIGREPHLSGSGSSLFLVGSSQEELVEMRNRLETVLTTGSIRFEVVRFLI